MVIEEEKMKNSNIVHIALDWQKQEQRRKNAKLLAPITSFCNDMGIKYNAHIDEGIKIGDRHFSFEQIKKGEALEFAKNPNLKCY